MLVASLFKSVNVQPTKGQNDDEEEEELIDGKKVCEFFRQGLC